MTTIRTRADAEAAGFEVDQHCYPWLAYCGGRMNPSRSRPVLTDLEAELTHALCNLIQRTPGAHVAALKLVGTLK